MVRLLNSASELPTGSHCVSFHATQDEACEQAVAFLEGARADQASAYWVANQSLVPMYRTRLQSRVPDRKDSVHALGHSQVHQVGEVLRPAPEVLEFISHHPDGVTAGGETITWFWTPETIHDYMEYETWFERQPRLNSRFICPYNLRRVPPQAAASVLHELGEHHSHVVLSRAPAKAVRLIQLFLFANAREVPEMLQHDLTWAVDAGLVQVHEPSPILFLTASGHQLIEEWATSA